MVLGLNKFPSHRGMPKGLGVFRALSLALLLFGCTQVEYDNPYDPDGVNYHSSSSLAVISSSSSLAVISSSSDVSNVFTDPRDGKAYKFETAPDGKIWMSENLNYSRNNTLGYCYGVDIAGADPHQDASGCDDGYGRVYEWSVAMDGNSPQGLCPDGWRIPSTAEWNSIINNYNNRIMSLDFYIYPGNYNTNSEYPPLGWKERDKSGFYWTSSGNAYFTGFWDGDLNSSYSTRILEIQSFENDGGTKFSVRCSQDERDGNLGNSSSSQPTSSSSGGQETKSYTVTTDDGKSCNVMIRQPDRYSSYAEFTLSCPRNTKIGCLRVYDSSRFILGTKSSYVSGSSYGLIAADGYGNGTISIGKNENFNSIASVSLNETSCN